MNKFFIFTILIIVAIAGFFGFWYYRDTIFSKEILKLEILGPDTVKMGDELSYTVKYKNNGNFALENPKIIFELPDNTLTEDGKTRVTQDLKDIYPGDENFVTFKARLLGKEGDLKVSHAWLSYVPKNLSARYESDTTFTTKISAVPITLTYDLPSKIEKGKEIVYSINYFSNIEYPLENLSLKVDPVNGFNVKSAEPTSLDNAEWKLPTLNKAQGGRINIRGLVLADTGSRLTFSAKLGMWIDGSFIVVKEVSQDIEVINSLLFISEQVNHSFNYIASPGENLHYEIFLRNIGATPFDNVFVVVKLLGSMFDASTLKSSEGTVRPTDSLVVFDSKQISKLQHIDPQQEVTVFFEVTLKDNWVPSDAEKNHVLVKNQVSVSDINQEFSTRVNSNLALTQKAYHLNQGGIENLGSIPPEVNKTTTYTINWQVKNYFNDVKNVKVRAILPEGVTLAAKILPEDQISKFSLDSASRQIVWSVGNLSAGAGVLNAPPSLSFQISLTPSFLQKGNLAGLIGQATISGEDQATGVAILGTVPAVDTSLPDDKINSGGGIVK